MLKVKLKAFGLTKLLAYSVLIRVESLYTVHVHCCCLHLSQEWDIDALEESTRYDGFKETDQVIV